MSKLVNFIINGLAVFGGVTLCLIFMANFGIDCTDLILRRAISPDGTYHGEIFKRYCKSNKTDELNIGIEKADSGKRQTMVLGPGVTTDLELSWISPTKLEIIYPYNISLSQDPREHLPFFEDVWISFRPKYAKKI